MVGRRCRTTHRFHVMHKLSAGMEPTSTKNGATSILTQESNLWTSKTPISEVSYKWNAFDKFTKKSSLTIVSEFFQICTGPKFLQMFPVPT